MGDPGISNGNGHGHSHSSLPHKNDPHIYLVEATEEENLAQQVANSSEWKGVLTTLDSYLRREHMLANQDLTKDGAQTSWVLVYQPPNSSSRQVLCGCETIRKMALVGRNGKVEEEVSHAVGSVFCPPAKRGKGYAGRMIKDLGEKLRHWQPQNGKSPMFSTLYSDIGRDFYAAHAWHPFPSAHVTLPAVCSVADGLPPVRLLQSEDLPELCDIDEEMTRARLSRAKHTPAVAIRPNYPIVQWHHAREEYIGREVFDRIPRIKGAVVGEVGSRVWCYWTHVWTNPQEDAPNTLHILRLVIEDEAFSDFAPATPEAAAEKKGTPLAQSIAALFAAAQSEAAAWGMREVLLWNPTSTALAAAQSLDGKAAVEHRQKESIASLRWYGEGSWEDVDWICNEKYGWS